MRGSIVRRKDRFSVVTDIPPGPDGKRKQEWHSGCPTRREAEQQLRRVLCELDAGRWVEPSDRTVAAYLLEDGLPAMATTVRPATLRIYRQSITACVLPALGHRRLGDLDPLLLTKHGSGRRGGRPGRRHAGTRAGTSSAQRHPPCDPRSTEAVSSQLTAVPAAFAGAGAALRWRLLDLSPTGPFGP